MATFGTGGDRFTNKRAVTPGPGDYDPKLLEHEREYASSFRTAERSWEISKEGEGERSSPQRDAQRGVNAGKAYAAGIQRVRTLEFKLSESKKQIRELRQELQQKNTDQASEVDALRLQLEDVLRDREALQLQVLQLQQQEQQLRKELQDSEIAAAEQLAAATGARDGLERQLEGLKEALGKVTAELDQVANERDHLQSEVQSAGCRLEQESAELLTVRESRDDLQEQLSLQAQELAAVRLQAQAAKEDGARAAGDLEASEKALEEKANALDAAEKALEEKANELSTMSAALAPLQAQADDAAAHRTQLEAELERLQQQVQQQEARAVQLQANADQAHCDAEEQDRAVQTLMTKLNASTATITTLTGALQSAEDDKAVKTEEIAAASLQLQAAQEDVVRLQAAGEAAEAARAEAEREVGEMRSQLGTAQERLAVVQGEREEAAALAAELTLQLEGAQRKAADESRVAAEATEQLRRQEVEAEEARLQLSAASTQSAAELAGAAQEMQELRQQAEELQAELDRSRDRMESSSAASAGSQLRIQMLEKDLEEQTARAVAAEAAAEQSLTMALETRRLADDNQLMAVRLNQMEAHIAELMGKEHVGLGHNNPKQKIQYHLRLKQELEELRHECTQLLRERFHLEQCVRYLAARCDMDHTRAGAAAPVPPGDSTPPRPCREKQRVDATLSPPSLACTYHSSTSIGKRQMAISARNRRSLREAPIYKSKPEMEHDIQQTRTCTATLLKDLASGDALQHMDMPVPVPDDSSSATSAPGPPELPHDVELGSHSLSCHTCSSTDAGPGSAPSRDSSGAPSVESRILAKITAICLPPGAKGRKGSQLMQSLHHDALQPHAPPSTVAP